MSSDVTFVVRPGLRNMGWQVRSQTLLGEGAVGPRLAKGTRFPTEIGVDFENKTDALRACESWHDWYYSQPYLRKKQKTLKYVA